jgi:hypothetical protein
MLAPMDIPGAAVTGTATVPWLLLGVVLGIALLVLVGAGTAVVVRRRPDRLPDDPGGDDLPGFLEFPPGSATPPAPAGWSPLATPPPPSTPPSRLRRDTLLPVIAIAVAALLLLGVAAVAARTEGGPTHARASDPTRPSGAAARLTFGGVVLEPRVVGVTATYPVIEVSTDGHRSRAQVEFPTFNCLTGEAPADPVAAGCARARTEYAELASPDLVVRRDGERVEITGRFATELRPNGSQPTATGRVYELRITVTPAGDAAEDGWRPARGVLALGTGRATTVEQPGVNVLRSGS